MKFDDDTMIRHRGQDEFDVYFARAALEEELGIGVAQQDRRGSLPNTQQQSPTLLTVNDSHRRVASCKYPSSRAKRKGGSVSPRDQGSKSPARRKALANAARAKDLQFQQQRQHSAGPGGEEAGRRTPEPGYGGQGEVVAIQTDAALGVAVAAGAVAAGAVGVPYYQTIPDITPCTTAMPPTSITVNNNTTNINMTANSSSFLPNARLLSPPDGPSSKTGDFKCHSAPHSRSSSWKKMRRPRSNRDLGADPASTGDADEDGSPRSRAGSIPFEETISQRLEQLRILQADDCYVVRNFTTSAKGIVNRGDSFKRKSISATSEAGSVGSNPGELDMPVPPAAATYSVTSQDSTTAPPSEVHHVLVVGYHGVGKTCLMQQFMTSEYMGAADTSFDDSCEKTVSVLLDGEETIMDFYDTGTDKDYRTYQDIDAYIVTFSLTDRISFNHAVDILCEIRRFDERHPAIIMVANKSDIVRSRQVSEEEGKEICKLNDCKYIEVSAALNHKVDDLLVGIVSQIRFQSKRLEKHKKKKKSLDESPHDSTCVKSAKGLLHRIFNRERFVSKSCDNLLVI